MHKIISSYKIEITLLFRSLLIKLCFIFTVSFVLLHFIKRFESFDAGGALISTAFIIQGGIFASMILGLLLIQKESYYWTDEVFFTLSDEYYSKEIGKCLALLTCITLLSGIVLILLNIFFKIYDVHNIFYWKSVQYILLYWIIPFFISGMIGMTVGATMHSRLVFPILIMVWLLIGPLNIAVFKPLMAMTGIDLNSVGNFLNLGQSDPNVMYDPVYGLPLETKRWIQKGIWLINIIIFFYLSILKKGNKLKNSVLMVILTLLITVNIPLIYAFTKSGQVVNTRYEKNAVGNYDISYYTVNNQPSFEHEDSFFVNSYDIDLDSFRNMKTTVKAKITLLETCNEIIFTLYHDFRVRNVFEGNKELFFTQKNDQLYIRFSQPQIRGTQKEIVISYEGTSSPYFYANNQAVMLPAYFPWIPVAGSFQTMKAKGSLLTRVNLRSDYPAKYTLKYLGSENIYSNLLKEKENIWSGESSYGITLATGMLTNTNIGSCNLIYPVTLDKMLKDVPDFLSNIKTINANIKKDLQISDTLHTDNLLFLSIPSESSLSDMVIWNLEDHTIIGINQMYNQGLLPYIEPVTIVLASLMRNCNTDMQSETMKNFFLAGYAYWHSLYRGGIFYDKSNRVLPMLIESYEYLNMREETYDAKKLKGYIDQNQSDPKLINSFFQAWLNKLNSAKVMQVEEIDSLFK